MPSRWGIPFQSAVCLLKSYFLICSPQKGQNFPTGPNIPRKWWQNGHFILIMLTITPIININIPILDKKVNVSYFHIWYPNKNAPKSIIPLERIFQNRSTFINDSLLYLRLSVKSISQRVFLFLISQFDNVFPVYIPSNPVNNYWKILVWYLGVVLWGVHLPATWKWSL